MVKDRHRGLTMFSPEQREAMRAELIALAHADPTITGIAMTGSASIDQEDRWSDIDLAFGVRGDLERSLSRFTSHMVEALGALDHLDVRSGQWIYRVFLLPSTLQVDLAFAPEDAFRAVGPTFKLVAGRAKPPMQPGSDRVHDFIGWAWLYALHARSSIERGKHWQAEFMVRGMRDQVVMLLCLRHGLPTREGRGTDRLPEPALQSIRECLVPDIEAGELRRAFSATTELLIEAMRSADPRLLSKIEGPLREMSSHPGK
jgi:hypothetical protein